MTQGTQTEALYQPRGVGGRGDGREAQGMEKTLESLLDCKEIKPINPKGNQS